MEVSQTEEALLKMALMVRIAYSMDELLLEGVEALVMDL